MNQKTVLAVMLILLALVWSLACDASDTKMERWAVKFTEPAIDVSAEQLYREFTRDDETAEDTYSGRRVRVSGVVFEVRDANDFEPVVEFDVGQDEWAFESLVAQFAEGHRTIVTSWAKGDEVSMVCYIPIDEFDSMDFDSVASLRMCQPL